jgi:hypothetical protein
VLDFLHGVMMVSDIVSTRIVVDSSLIDLNTNSEGVASSPLSMTSIDVVLFTFGEVIPF